MIPTDTEAQVYLICAVALLVGFVAAAAAAVQSLTVADREEQRRLRAERRVARLRAQLSRYPRDVDEAYRTAPTEPPPPAAPTPVTAPWAAAPMVWIHGARREHGGLW